MGSASNLAYAAAGRPAHQYARDQCAGVCATCGIEIDIGVHISSIETPATANHADYFRFGSKNLEY